MIDDGGGIRIAVFVGLLRSMNVMRVCPWKLTMDFLCTAVDLLMSGS